MPAVRSRLRYRNYLADLRRRFRGPQPEDGEGKPKRPRARSFLQLFGAFFGLLRGHYLALGLALATLTVTTLLALIPPASTKITVDNVLGDQPLPSWWTSVLPVPDTRFELLLWIAGVVVTIAFIDATIRLWGRWEATRVTQLVQAGMRRRLFEHMVRLPLDRVQELKSGGTSSILREDVNSIGELVFGLIYNPWRAVIQLLGSLAILWLVDWRLMLGSIAILPLVYLTHRTWIGRIRPMYRDIRALRQDVDSQATEAFGGIRVVRAFGRQTTETARYASGTHLLSRQQILVWWWARAVGLAWELLIPVASTALLVYGGWQVLDGHLTTGDLVMFLFYLAMLLGPLETLANSATQLQNGLSALDRVLDIMDESREMLGTRELVRMNADGVAGEIRIDNVSFHYPKTNKLVLHDINLDVQPGETIALVGRSGSGKTTLCNLIARFYDPTEGRILVDGQDLRHTDVESYRRMLGVVEQDVFLFDGTIAENISYARRHASEEEIVAAAEAAYAMEFIERLPDGLQTRIGERGVKLSGGQRQRIAIARAILADPKILILDEATSNLDTASERLIQASLEQLLENRTAFVIAHRLSTIRGADRILVLDQGRIVESGTHDELVALGEHYAQMVDQQLSMSAGAS
jgi:ATP-binding cassette subfamily B protein/subfamily B ATP-binding cassette protein MsbA